MCETGSGSGCGCFLKLLQEFEAESGVNCKDIVLNAYCGLCKSGVGECEAKKIAARILKYHRPTPGAIAEDVVECWVFEESRANVN